VRIDPDQMFRRFMAEIITDQLALQWRARAQRYRDARPRPGDFPGETTPEQRREQWRRLTEIAAACEARARFIELGHEEFPEIEEFDPWEAA